MKTGDLSTYGSPHECAIQIAELGKTHDLNEADTRHQIIDRVLHDVLSWPRSSTGTESYIDPGYADYYLKRSDESVLMIIEAKREGVYFLLPDEVPLTCEPRRVPIKTLMTDSPRDSRVV